MLVVKLTYNSPFTFPLTLHLFHAVYSPPLTLHLFPPLTYPPASQILHHRNVPAPRNNPHHLLPFVNLLMLFPRWNQRKAAWREGLLRFPIVGDYSAVAVAGVDDGVLGAVVVNCG